VAVRIPVSTALSKEMVESPHFNGTFVFDSKIVKLLTYFALIEVKLTACSRIILQKLIITQLVKKFPVFYGTRMFITMFTRAFS
jgi:hypothetical protein